MLQTAFYVALWYALNVGYNIYNKDTCNKFPYPWTVGCISLGAGLLYLLPVWSLGVRKIPKMKSADVVKIMSIAVLHTIGHFGAVLSMNAGAVSFTHIVKAAEPVFSTVLSGIILGTWAPAVVNLTLVPVMAGVIMASFGGLEFNWAAFAGAMISNLAFALRSIYMKKVLADKKDCEAKNLDSANVYAVYTIFSFMLSIPLALFFEGQTLMENWSTTVTAEVSVNEIVKLNLITGLFFYLYNESASLALGNLAAVAHAVCNTVKRVVIMIAVNVYFMKPMSQQQTIGSTIAIGGTLLYALVKNSVTSKAATTEKKKN